MRLPCCARLRRIPPRVFLHSAEAVHGFRALLSMCLATPTTASASPSGHAASRPAAASGRARSQPEGGGSGGAALDTAAVLQLISDVLTTAQHAPAPTTVAAGGDSTPKPFATPSRNKSGDGEAAPPTVHDLARTLLLPLLTKVDRMHPFTKGEVRSKQVRDALGVCRMCLEGLGLRADVASHLASSSRATRGSADGSLSPSRRQPTNAAGEAATTPAALPPLSLPMPTPAPALTQESPLSPPPPPPAASPFASAAVDLESALQGSNCRPPPPCRCAGCASSTASCR